MTEGSSGVDTLPRPQSEGNRAAWRTVEGRGLGQVGCDELTWDKDVEGEKAKKTLLVAGIGGHSSQDEAESVLCLFTITLCVEFNSPYVMNEGTEGRRGREAGQGHTAAWRQDSNPISPSQGLSELGRGSTLALGGPYGQ